MVTVILLRHGQTASSQNHNLIEGWSETPLTPEGQEQVRLAANKIKAHHQVERIFSSPIKRARETANIVSAILGVDFNCIMLLAERKFGDLEGKTWDWVTAKYGKEIRERDQNGAYDYTPWKGDSAERIRQNIEFLKNYLQERFDNKTVVCVTHGGILRMLGFMVPWNASAEYKVVQW